MAQSEVVTNGWGEATIDYLSRLPSSEWPTQRRLAQRLSISERFLRQRYYSEGVTYRWVKGLVRRQRAEALFASGIYKTVGEISDELGFSDESSFRKSFKKWTGCTPSAFLKALHGTASPGR